jgi:hypothetical protein
MLAQNVGVSHPAEQPIGTDTAAGTWRNRDASPRVGRPGTSPGVPRNQPLPGTFERALLHTPTHTQRRVPPVTRVLKLAAAATGAAVVAIAAFLLHPRSGARRRAAARRATVGVASLVGSAVDKRPRRSNSTWDETLADRVRVALSMGFGDLATGLEIRANRGVITLRGEVDELTDITRFETAVREVGDVVDVDNLLRLRMRDLRPHVLSA